LKNKISHNYFTGEKAVPLSSTLEEAEVLFAANDNIKSMASSGALKDLHDNFATLQNQSESLYISTRDKIENIIKVIESKE
jgi:maltose-binding protein MalE